MAKIIIDSNIAFSAMLNVNSRIGQILLRGKLWTGDKKLIKGLTDEGIFNVSV